MSFSVSFFWCFFFQIPSLLELESSFFIFKRNVNDLSNNRFAVICDEIRGQDAYVVRYRFVIAVCDFIFAVPFL